jgi:signal peptidase II
MAMRAVPANRYVVFFSIALVGCLIDLVTKSYMFGWLGIPGEQPTWWVISNVFGFQTSLNEGALFGMGQGMVPLFACLSIAAAIGIFLWLFRFGAARDWLLTVALGCVTAGIFGNLYDRLGIHGLKWGAGHPLHEPGDAVFAVRDWILVMIGRWPWPTFNIADSLLVCGAGMLVWHACFYKDEHKQASAEGAAACGSDGGAVK